MSDLEDFFYICKIDELKESEGKRFYINDADIAVFKIREEIFVVSNICPHQHAPVIHEAFVEDKCVVCPLHGWTFKLTDGKLHSGSRGLDAFPVKIIDEKVYAKVVQKELNW